MDNDCGPGPVGARPYEDARLADAYHHGNAMPESALRAWAELIASFAPCDRPSVLEVGSGTGMFCVALARWGGVSRVLGVEPSPVMLTEARRYGGGPGAALSPVRYLAGAAEALPLADGDGGDLALLSRVVHHLPDRPACARELARVLGPGGVLVIRTTYRDRLDALVYRYWPQLLDSDRRRFPGRDELVADFATAGFAVRRELSFGQPVAGSLGEYHERLATRPQSKFGQLDPAAFRAGLRRLAADADRERDADQERDGGSGTQPVAERYDVLVLALPGGRERPVAR